MDLCDGHEPGAAGRHGATGRDRSDALPDDATRIVMRIEHSIPEAHRGVGQERAGSRMIPHPSPAEPSL
jgi:hypothetical protein